MLSITVSGAVERVLTLGTVVPLPLAGVSMSVTPVISWVTFASVEFLVLMRMVGRARVGVAGGCAVLMDAVSAVRGTSSAGVGPGAPPGGGVETTPAVLCIEVAFVVIVTVVLPGVVSVSSAAV